MSTLSSLFSRLELSPAKGLWLQALLSAVAVAFLLVLTSMSPVVIVLAVVMVVVFMPMVMAVVVVASILAGPSI